VNWVFDGENAVFLATRSGGRNRIF